MIVSVRVYVGEDGVMYPVGIPVRDPSWTRPVGTLLSVLAVNDHEYEVKLDLDDEALRVRLAESRRPF